MSEKDGLCFWVKDVYKEGKINIFNGYRILAIDGTTFELPYTEELKEEFGEVKNNNGVLKKVLGRGSILYDVENTLVIDGILDKYSSNERAMAISHLETWLEMKKEINDKKNMTVNMILLNFRFIIFYFIREINFIVNVIFLLFHILRNKRFYFFAIH